MGEKTSQFEKLLNLNVNDKAEKKNGLTYLSWSYAWAEFKKVYPDATYNILKNEKGLPYFYDEMLGYMVYTTVTADGQTYEMWLPVMDGANKSMKAEPYTYKTKYGEKTVEAATMFDINKTVMRCLVKNLAMFGLGLYIYSGEDLPEEEAAQKAEEDKKKQEEKVNKIKQEKEKITPATIKQINILAKQFADAKGRNIQDVFTALQEKFKYTDINQITNADGMTLCNQLVSWNRTATRTR